MSNSSTYLSELAAASAALQKVLGAIIERERRYAPGRSPLALFNEITTDPEWVWLQPLLRLIADIDHALDDKELPATEVAAIGAHARALLSGAGAPIEQQFLERYRALLPEPDIAIVHAAALQALRKLPAEPDSEAERLHAHHQWAMRRKHRLQS